MSTTDYTLLRAYSGGEVKFIWEDDRHALEYLDQQGYKLNGDFSWTPPTPDHVETDAESSALWFLFHEHDYGDVEPHPAIEKAKKYLARGYDPVLIAFGAALAALIAWAVSLCR